MATYLFECGPSEERLRALRWLYYRASCSPEEIAVLDEIRALYPDIITQSSFTGIGEQGEKGKEMRRVMLTGLGKRLVEELGIHQLAL